MRLWGTGYDMLGLPGMWVSVWTRPWLALGDWNAVWSDWHGSWRRWMESMATLPVAWLPALAAEREEKSPELNFFLPWLPRIEAQTAPPPAPPNEAAVRVPQESVGEGGVEEGGVVEKVGP
ncbi:MAG: hypothetical protein LBI92_08945 [Azoarcus sp.]|jgi:hypothetical protein|nr:hypothetical protein [Azoarcus sp.]